MIQMELHHINLLFRRAETENCWHHVINRINVGIEWV